MTKLFLSIKDLMFLTGSKNYNSAWKKHKAIREAILPGKKGLTIREYCRHEGWDYEEIYEYLQEKQ